MSTRTDPGRVVAVLGPTNTGKTHFALERMLGHTTGMIGFPLRLLAREIYDRIVRLRGAGSVALITGEERIVPAHPRWFVCTVEAMPLDRRVAFLAIDEIQLCADPERGHVFTDRLLHARGEAETAFLGADTIRPLLRRLVPEIEFVARPRLSNLIHTGPRKLDRLPPRSVVVAFSASEVYALAESVRRARGGVAVVLGALSPRTRNAQVGLYQTGEVDYIVATDAIGMGLNLDVDHVAFASLSKFDGRAPRPLAPAEIAQIAGRAGRHMNDGSFGTTADAGPLDTDLALAVENHRFEPLKALSWRNADLRFASIPALLASLERPPNRAGLVRARIADDHLALTALAATADIASLAVSPQRVRLLWEVCQIPDFRKVMDESHPRLLGRIFSHLAGPAERLPTDWLAENIARLDRTDGEIDTIVARIAAIRTWTFVTHRANWVDDPSHWQGLTRAIEDRLSDALHDRLTHRFVDRRTAVLMRRLRQPEAMAAEITGPGEVRVEGQYVGRLVGFAFVPDQTEGAGAARTVAAAAQRALKTEIVTRLDRLLSADEAAFSLTAEGIMWGDALVARLESGADPLRPQANPLVSDLIEPAARERLRRRLTDIVQGLVARDLAPLIQARAAGLDGAARGLVYQLAEGLGSLASVTARGQIAALDEAGRKALARLGIRLGRESVFMPTLLKPNAQRVRALLWGVGQDRPPPPVPGRRVALACDANIPTAFYEAVGYPVRGGIAVRADSLERFAAEARRLGRNGSFALEASLTSVLRLSPDLVLKVLSGLGFEPAGTEGGTTLMRPIRRSKPRNQRPPRPAPNSPFAVLLQRRP
ncbi:helicase-related protein [Magnetospirillum molischianum]|uniref:Superfamily II DNA and RNA helicase n=1 Tax=Magnetospirillum molischianum DSM 120 TaxID=1150626 RepID=H8FQX4_MAGML|nr:helicase-related protein [Magnetospirillum molischianum]CCG40762.1 Superfamily II DNA and RNA helicase [Magnetospirillum molischianum DSM 120]